MRAAQTTGGQFPTQNPDREDSTLPKVRKWEFQPFAPGNRERKALIIKYIAGLRLGSEKHQQSFHKLPHAIKASHDRQGERSNVNSTRGQGDKKKDDRQKDERPTDNHFFKAFGADRFRTLGDKRLNHAVRFLEGKALRSKKAGDVLRFIAPQYFCARFVFGTGAIDVTMAGSGGGSFRLRGSIGNAKTALGRRWNRWWSSDGAGC